MEPDPGVVETAAEGHGQSLPPLIVLDRVESFLDEHGLGSGRVRARRIGVAGGSNFTFLLERGAERYVLRRPPRPPLPPSAHDVLREARLQLALARQRIRVPSIVALCDDTEVIGVPFYVMEYLDGDVIGENLPAQLAEDVQARRRLGLDLVDTLVEIHQADVREPALAAFARPGSYAERQVRRFAELWPLNATRGPPGARDRRAPRGEHFRAVATLGRARRGNARPEALSDLGHREVHGVAFRGQSSANLRTCRSA